MAVQRSSSSTTDTAKEFISAMKDIRDTVRDERVKRLAKEPAKTRLTYHSGQEARASSGKSRSGSGSGRSRRRR